MPVIISLAFWSSGELSPLALVQLQITRKPQGPHLLYSFSHLHITLLIVLITKLLTCLFYLCIFFAKKLCGYNLSRSTIDWITDYLTSRPQYVRVHDAKSKIITTNIGAPQVTVLSPFFIDTLYF